MPLASGQSVHDTLANMSTRVPYLEVNLQRNCTASISARVFAVVRERLRVPDDAAARRGLLHAVLAGLSGRLAVRPVQVRIALQNTACLTFACACRMNLLPVVHMLVALAENAAVANLLVVFPGTSMACSCASDPSASPFTRARGRGRVSVQRVLCWNRWCRCWCSCGCCCSLPWWAEPHPTTSNTRVSSIVSWSARIAV